MSKKILVFGLPGSGKSTIANKLFQRLANAVHINADAVRKEFNDWDFSDVGRLRQANRMIDLSKVSKKQWVIVDFVCPSDVHRSRDNFDITIFMDTLSKSRFENTNKVFELPKIKPDFHFTEFDSDKQVDLIVKKIQSFDWKMPTVQLLGRWQPWHAGHFELFKRAFKKTGQVVIQVRDTCGVDEKNPFDFETVQQNIIENLSQNNYVLGQDYIVQQVPNITNITYGRDVGYTIERETLEEKIEKISATKIRSGINLRKKINMGV